MFCPNPSKQEGECAPSVRKGRCRATPPTRQGRHGQLPPPDKDARTSTTEAAETEHPILRGRRLATERPRSSEGGKICAPCVIRGTRAAKRAPSRQDLRVMHSRTALCGDFRMHSARILPKPAHFGYMAAISCHELAFFPSEAPSGTHRSDISPLPDA